MKRLTFLLLCLGAACGDIHFVELERRSAPGIHINIGVNHTDSAEYDLSAVLAPGIDPATQKPNEVVQPRLFVQGVPVEPKTQPDLSMSYDWLAKHRPAQGALDTLRLALPVIATLAPTTAVIRLPRREDPFQVTIGSDDLRLHVSPMLGDPSEMSRVFMFWQLDIRESCEGGSDPGFQIRGTSAYPGEMRIPAAWISSIGRDSAMACFVAMAGYRVAGATYDTDVVIAARIRWLLRRS